MEELAHSSLLDELLEKRLNCDKTTEETDVEICQLFSTVKCILFTDICGFTSYVQNKGIIAFLQKMYRFKKIFLPIVDENHGEIIKIEGDSVIAVFESVSEAIVTVRRALTMLEEYNRGKYDAEKIELCSGIGYGEILQIGKSDVFGYEVNIASKLGEDMAGAREIFISEAAKVNIIQTNLQIDLEKIQSELKLGSKAYKVVS